ncbi:hypothetical protein HDU93_004487 [Gonapodya sp. JEL0774]|nr:hypothetical protein HDU93_004487 [Gonapodya sp. JEL0774]
MRILSLSQLTLTLTLILAGIASRGSAAFTKTNVTALERRGNCPNEDICVQAVSTLWNTAGACMAWVNLVSENPAAVAKAVAKLTTTYADCYLGVRSSTELILKIVTEKLCNTCATYYKDQLTKNICPIVQLINDGDVTNAFATDQFKATLSYCGITGKRGLKCPSDKEQNGALCYPWCQSGYKGVGPVCWENCPGGWTDTGAFCSTAPEVYGKGCSIADPFPPGSGKTVAVETAEEDSETMLLIATTISVLVIIHELKPDLEVNAVAAWLTHSLEVDQKTPPNHTSFLFSNPHDLESLSLVNWNWHEIVDNHPTWRKVLDKVEIGEWMADKITNVSTPPSLETRLFVLDL